GTNRYDTAAKVAQAGLNSYGLIASEVLLASGADFADALAAGPFGFKRTAPLILTEPGSLPPQSAAFLEDNSSAIQKVTAVGGTAAVSATALTQAEKAAETPSNDRQNEGIQVSPQSADSLANSGTRSFVANGITSATVDIVLVPCANVSNDNGSTKFVNSNGGSVADKTNRPGATPPAVAPDDADAGNVRISSVNGTPTSEAPHRNEYANNVAPVNGVVSFDVAGPGATDTSITCVVPVVFQDSNSDDALNVGAGNPAAPTERFGTGGRTTFGPTAAGSGDFTVNVTSIDNAANTFTGCTLSTPTDTVPEVSNSGACSSYAWDGTDTYQTGETPNTASSSLAGFEANLSIGDDVAGTYTPSGDSTFRLVDEAPLAPTGVTATQGAGPGPTATATVTFTPSTTSVTPLKTSTLVHNVYRLTLVPSTGTCPAFGAGAYTKVNSSSATSPYNDSGLLPATYCYVVTAAVNGATGTRGETAAAPVKVTLT
ncbi:MAG: cell wall-binding repeat-containing protein, partial [Acidobacteria bacterium]|nr:cell wall-binding repeat-containing protein [Acidobacteriota bacterium]